MHQKNGLSHAVIWLVLALIALNVLTAAGPAVVALAQALVPLVLVVGCVIALLRIVRHFTDRY